MERLDLKNLAALVVAVAGLATSVGALVHRPPEDAAKASYEELVSVIVENQAAQRRDHDDLVALREFVDQYARGHQVLLSPLPPAPNQERPEETRRALSKAAPGSPTPPPVASSAPPRPPRAPADMRW